MQQQNPSPAQTPPRFARRPGPRGVQLEEVLAAADALVAKGLKPTIERVRQHLGGGSPNTVSPMLDVWYERLPARLIGVPSPETRAASDGPPLAVIQAAEQFWDVARREAAQAQIQQTEATRRELELQKVELARQDADLRLREAAFEQARKSLDAALASSQQACELLEKQMADQAAEAAQHRKAADLEVARLGRLLAEAQASKEALRVEHAAAIAARERVAQQAEERHGATERRLLLEVDRAREEARLALVSSGKDKSARAQAEQQLIELRERLDEELRAVRAAAAQDLAQAAQEKADASVRQAQEAAVLAHARAELESVATRWTEARALHEREMQAHQATRELLKQAMTSRRSGRPAGRSSAKPPSAG